MAIKTKKTTTKKKTSKKKVVEETAHDLIFITSERCGWCKKAEPVVDELRESGFTITSLDMTIEEEAKRANEIKKKHSAACGTPLFIDAVTGNSVCGFREKDVLEKWANGEEIPKPPPRKPNPNARPRDNANVDEGELLPELLQSYKIFVGKSKTAKGYGVFAAEDISKDEVLEEAPYVRTAYRTKDLMYPQLTQICYPFPCSCDDCRHRGATLCLASGNIQLYNHDAQPSIKFEWDMRARVITVRAIRDIKEGEEIFNDYGAGYRNFEGVAV